MMTELRLGDMENEPGLQWKVAPHANQPQGLTWTARKEVQGEEPTMNKTRIFFLVPLAQWRNRTLASDILAKDVLNFVAYSPW
jgi:hypothetical protein